MEPECSPRNYCCQRSAEKRSAELTDDDQNHRAAITRSWKNVIIMGLIFLLIGSAENTILFVQSSIHSDGGMGVISSSVVSITSVVSSLILPTFLIDIIGLKKTLGISIIGYIFYIGTNAFGSWGTLIAGGAVQGLVQGPVWTSSSCYIRAVGLERAEITGEDPELIVAKFFSIFYLMYQLSNIPSCLVSSLILSSPNNFNGSSTDNILCGKDFCPSDESINLGNQTQNPAEQTSATSIYILVGACACISASGLPLTFLGLDQPAKEGTDSEDDRADKPKVGRIRDSILSAIVLHKHLRMWLIMPLAFTNGVVVTFTTAEWTQAFLSCSLGVNYIGWGILPYAFTCSISSYGCEWLQEKTNRLTVFSISSLVTCGVSTYFLLWSPGGDQLWLFLLLSALWGIGESPWYPLVTALYGETFPDQSDGAYANNNVYFGLGSAVAYAYSDYLCTNVKIYIVIASVIFAMFCYIISLVVSKEKDVNCIPDDEKILRVNEHVVN